MQPSTDNALRLAWWILLVVTLGVVLLVRIRLLEIPLERDEGEYAYAGQLLLRGVPPYQAAYNLKFPGTYVAYAVVMAVFGESIRGIHLGLLLVNACAIVLIFLIGRQLMSLTAGIAAAASYAVLTVSPSVLGFAAHATHFVVLPVLAGLWLLLRNGHARNGGVVFAAGVLFGIGVLMKQPAVFFVPFGAIFLAGRDRRAGLPFIHILRRSGLFLAAAALPTALMCLLIWRLGLFEKFWFWTVTYAREYAGLISFAQAKAVFSGSIARVLAPAWPVWSLALFGIVASFARRTHRFAGVVLVAFLASAAVAVSVGFYFRPHYFVLALPAVCLCAGAAFDWAESRRAILTRVAALLLFAGVLAFSFLADRAFFFHLSPTNASRSVYPGNPFPETLAVAEFLRARSAPHEKIAILGSEPQIAFYAQRRSATGYLYTYALMEAQPHALAMQREMIREIEAAQPKYLVFINVAASWNVLARSPRLIFDWMKDYTAAEFEVSGVVELLAGGRTEYHLPAPRGMVAKSRDFIVIYERKPAALDG